MKIKHKYIRNRHFRIKNWKRVRCLHHPFETYCPWFKLHTNEWSIISTYDEQVKREFEIIEKEARALETGAPTFQNSPSWYRRNLNRKRNARTRVAMKKINAGDYDIEVPFFKNDVDWFYF